VQRDLRRDLLQKTQKKSCAQQLVPEKVPLCKIRIGHLDYALKVYDGVTIINNATAAVKTTDENSQLNLGTLLSTFTDRVAINESWFVNHQGVLRKNPVASALSRVKVTLHRERPNSRYLHDLSLRNHQTMGDFKKDLVGIPILSSFAVVSITLACCMIIWYIRRCVNRPS